MMTTIPEIRFLLRCHNYAMYVKNISLAKEKSDRVTRQNQSMLLFPLHIKFHMKVLMYITIPYAVERLRNQ